MKQIIRLTENDLHRIVRESVERVLTESQGEIQAYINAIKAGVYDKLLQRDGLMWIHKLRYKGDISELLSVAEKRYNELTGSTSRVYDNRRYVRDWDIDPDMGWH